MIGKARLYSYNNLREMEFNTCGQAAIATILDYFDRVPAEFQRTVRGRANADDGKFHCDNSALVGALTRRYPPIFVIPPGIPIPVTVREVLLRAFHDHGLHAREAYPEAWNQGGIARKWLMDYIAATGNPVVVLVDIFYFNIGAESENALHWGVIHAFDDSQVVMASWHDNFLIPWNDFMAGWHCKNLPYPNNFYQIQFG